MNLAAPSRYPLRVHFTRLLLVLCLLLASLPGSASARRQREFPYAFDQVWNAALRLVRVDLRFAVTDRDPEGGYVLFEYEAQGKRYPGSLELVAQTRGAQVATVAVAQVKGMPTYVEQMILDRLDKKLLSDFGPPPAPPKPTPAPAPKPPPEADAGSDAPAGEPS